MNLFLITPRCDVPRSLKIRFASDRRGDSDRSVGRLFFEYMYVQRLSMMMFCMEKHRKNPFFKGLRGFRLHRAGDRGAWE